MADIELRKRIAAVIAHILDGPTLDRIHDQLLSAGQASKVPVTIKITFSADDGGMLSAVVEHKTVWSGAMRPIKLHSDGRQLSLGEPVAVSRPEPAADPADDKQAARLAVLREQAKKLYLEGKITDAMARQAGVDVESLKEGAPF